MHDIAIVEAPLPSHVRVRLDDANARDVLTIDIGPRKRATRLVVIALTLTFVVVRSLEHDMVGAVFALFSIAVVVATVPWRGVLRVGAGSISYRSWLRAWAIETREVARIVAVADGDRTHLAILERSGGMRVVPGIAGGRHCGEVATIATLVAEHLRGLHLDPSGYRAPSDEVCRSEGWAA